ncbi:hypothetical protein [Bradyrhizobium sp. S69]|uniref:hypothetical protein n=1 Tax=Bradyrhizobium sp. S69 TaxID=1641856 RepID=UPI001AED68DF|nr:hypothetical protein [Bradyrhizobium sp. S69]
MAEIAGQTLWPLLDAAFLVSLFGATLYAIDRKAVAVVLAALACWAAIPVYLILEGNLWAAGKAVSIASAFIFIALTCPMAAAKRAIAIPAAVLVRPPSRLRRAAPDRRILERWSADLAGCARVAVLTKYPTSKGCWKRCCRIPASRPSFRSYD